MNTAANLNLVVSPIPSSIAHTTNGSNSNTSSVGGVNSNNNNSTASTTTTNTATTNTTNQTTNTTITTTTSGSLSDSLASGTTEGNRTPSSTNLNDGHLSRTNLYIKGLQAQTTDQDLYNMCSRFGHISSTKAIQDKTTRSCKGYGFVEFTTPQSAKVAVQELTKSGVQAQMAKLSPLYQHHHNQHHHQHHHHHHHNNNNSNTNTNNNNHTGNISSNSSHNNSNNSYSSLQHNQQYSNHNNNADPTNLYIANLPPNMSEQELENLLSTYGPVVSTRILRTQSNMPRGVGFARMESRDKCEQIIEQLNGRPCKGWKEPLLIKFADGGNKKRHHHNNQHQHQSNNHHQHHKVHQYDNRWRDNGNSSVLGSVSSFDHQGNISHSNHLSDLAMMSTMSYPRMKPGFPPAVDGGAYPTPMGPPTSAPQWIHPSGQPYVIPQQMIQAGGMPPSNQAALHYGHIPQLASQMQGLQIAHPGGPVGGYLPPQHQWSALWTHPIPQQPQPSMRMTGPIQRLPTAQQSQSPQTTPVQQQQPQQQQPPVAQQSLGSESKLQVSMPLQQ